jgi:hypothetical protein
MEVPEQDLRHAVERQHHCHATLAYVEPVSEEYGGEAVWEGQVHVFDVTGHPKAKQAFAWSSPIDGSTKRRFFAVLQMGPIQTPVDAVRAAIVAEHRAIG